MSKEMSKDAEAYDREYDAFLKQLEDFHQQRGTPFKRLPRINGKGVDLYLLYVVVTARGGWQKVNSRNEWDELLEDFRLPASCVNSSTALKHIYIRYLDAYERINFLGEDGEERGVEMDDGEDSRSLRTKKTIRSLNSVPLAYNHQQHNVIESIRGGAGLSTDLFKPSSYDKLSLGLVSPLPNEHDFALNICTILSNEGRHVLQLAQCPRLVEHMLAHAGLYKDWETQKYFLSNYKAMKGRSLVQFWIDSVEDHSVLDLLTPEALEIANRLGFSALSDSKSSDVKSENGANNINFSCNFMERYNKENSMLRDTSEFLLGGDSLSGAKSKLLSSESGRSTPGVNDRLSEDSQTSTQKEGLQRRLEKLLEVEGSELVLAKEEGELFHLGRDLGQQDGEGTRIGQILHIIRNLSFEEINVPTLAKSQTCLRFLVLCMWSRWGGLTVNALDTLGNIAPEVTLRNPRTDACTAALLTHICNGVSSPDRAFVLRSLEVLNKLAISDRNDEILCNHIDPSVYGQICRYLTIHDIMLLIYTLECLYSLSSLGTPACNAIVRAKGSIHTLVSLLTVEAQSYGPEACIGMKVVETVTGVVSEPEPAPNPPPPVPVPPQNLPTAVMQTAPGTVAVNAVTGPLLQQIPLTPKQPLGATPGDKKIAGRIVPPDVEEFVMEWVTKNYEASPGNAIEQAIVYRHFAASMHSLGRKQGLNPVLLSNCVRKVFGTGVGPSRRPVEDGVEKWHYNGIRRRDGVVVPPLPDKKKGSRTIGATLPMYTATPVLPAVNNQAPSSHVVTVSRNLQKQQLQQHTDSQDSSSDSQLKKTSSFNGICNEIKREDDSNSFMSSAVNDKRVTSFEGILQNGIKTEMDEQENVKAQESSKVKKNVLADLLERTVGGDILNGVVERDLRISDKGLEFVNHGQQVKANGPVTNNGQSGNEASQGGIKRPATPDDAPAKRIALEDPRGTPGMDSRITLYVSQNGSESGEVISQGHQVVLSQGQQATPSAPQQMVVSQAMLAGNQSQTAGTTQTVVTPQGQVILQRPATQQGVIVQQGGQILTQGGGAGQVIQQVIQQGQSGPQKVILHQGQLGQVLGGQVILSQGSSGQQVMVQGGNSIQGQVIMQGVPHCQGQVFLQGNNTQSQFVVSGTQGQTMVVPGTQGQQQVVVSSAQGQTMIVAGSQGQPMMVSGQQGQSGQVVVPGNVGGTVLLAPQQQGSTAKTLIILPNPKMVISGAQQGGQGQQIVLPRQVAGQQVVQLVSSSNTVPVTTVTSAVRTVRAATPVTDTRATPTPPPVQYQSNSSTSTSNSSSSTTTASYSVQSSAALPAAIAPAPAGPTAVPVAQSSVSQAPQTPHVPAPQVLSSGVARRNNSTGLQYICEWRGCNNVFSSAAQVYHHACKVHCPPHIAEIQCGWAGCDTMTRRRFSAMTHLHDRHCNEQLLQILAVRRSQLASSGKTDIPIPQAPPPHPGYAPNAAFHAIKRHALEVINQRDAVEKEGPVTKSIRLTSALILRNLVIYSNMGKKLLQGYEAELSNVAVSTMESSRTVAQILYDIRLPDHQGM